MKTLKSILFGLTATLLVVSIMTSCEQEALKNLAGEDADLHLETGHTCSECSMPFAGQKPDEIVDVLIQYSETGEPVTEKAARYGNTIVYEGDVILTENYTNEIALRGNIISDFSRKWPNSTMPYVWGGGLTQAKKNEILNAIANVNATTNLCLVERTNETQYVKFENTRNSCHVLVIGNTGAANQVINIGNNCGRHAIIHEILHKAGFYHEQTRSDRDNFITVNWDNLDGPGWEYQFTAQGGETASGAYDFASIMHYPQYHPDVTIDDSQPIFFIKDPSSLPAGMTANQIGILPDMSATDIAAVNALYPVDCGGGSSGSTRYEAENATLIGVFEGRTVSGYSGTGHVQANTFDNSGDKIKFTVNVPTSGSYPLAIRYYNQGNGKKYQNISINGASNNYTLFPAASSWSTLDYGNVSLNAGNNTIEIKKSWGWTNIDYIEIDAGGGSSTVQKLEAENATLTGVSTGTSVGGYSGAGHVLASTFKDSGDRIRFNVNVSTSGSYPLVIRYYNQGNGKKYQHISINGGSNKYTLFPAASSWSNLNYGNINLNAGNNTIDIKKSWGWTNVDYIQIGG